MIDLIFYEIAFAQGAVGKAFTVILFAIVLKESFVPLLLYVCIVL